MAVRPGGKVVRLARLCLLTPDAARLADFYRRAFGCRVVARASLSAAAAARLVGVSGRARSVSLVLGAQHLQLLQPAAPGRAYPASVPASDVRFQHFAIVVDDMPRAYEHLSRVGGWTRISTHGPQRLPVSSGGVTAFKFRDPDGHPLELLAFAPATARAGATRAGGARSTTATPFRGIDHSAICVADSTRSIAFYESLGLRVSARSINHGLQQQRLDGLEHARVQVVALSPRQAPPHVELLCYRASAPSTRGGKAGRDTGGSARPLPNDVAATRLVFESGAAGAPPRHLRDPDGHRLIVCCCSAGGGASGGALPAADR